MAASTSSTVTPGAVSTSTRPASVTSITAMSVMIRWTQCRPVRGRVHSSTNLRVTLLGDVLHHDDDALGAVDQVHRAAHPLDHRAGHHPVRDVTLRRDLHGSENRDVDLAAANHSEGGRGVEVRRTGNSRDGFLAGVDEFRVEFFLGRVRADAEHAVLRVQDDLDVGIEVVRHQRGHADTEIDVLAVGQFPCHTGRHLLTGEPADICLGHARTVRFSMPTSTGPTCTTR